MLMTAFTIAAAWLTGIVVGIIGLAWISAPERVRRDAEAQDAINRANQHAEDAQAAYNEREGILQAWRSWASLLEHHILDTREEAAAALFDNPTAQRIAEQIAANEVRRLDVEWFDWSEDGL